MYGQPTTQGLNLHRSTGADLQSASGRKREPEGEPAVLGRTSESIKSVDVNYILIAKNNLWK